jgi:hypothetical protein
MRKERIAVFLCCERHARVVSDYHIFIDEGERSTVFSRERLRVLSNPEYPPRLKARLRKFSRITVFSRVLYPSGEIEAGLESLPPRVRPMAPVLDLRRSLGRGVHLAAFSCHAEAAPIPQIIRNARELEAIAWHDPLLLWSPSSLPELERDVLTNLENSWADRSAALMLGVFDRGYVAVALPLDDDAGLGYAIYCPHDITAKARRVWRTWARSHGVELYEGTHPDRLFVDLRDPRHRIPRGVRRLV